MTMEEKPNDMFNKDKVYSNVELNKMQYKVNMAESFLKDSRKKGIFNPDEEMTALGLLKDLDSMVYRFGRDKEALKRIESMKKQLMSIPELRKKHKRRWFRKGGD